MPRIKDKRVGIVVNHTSMVNDVHLVDTLISLGIDVKLIWAPEHGFGGKAYNGEKVEDELYNGQILIRSLYGKNRKPAADDLADIDVIIFDIQDVGARFYTYISTLHYVMEAAAEIGVKVIILDRPNPNAHYIDGPIREDRFKSFVGMHPVPIVYGMTIGEYGQMINGERWLEEGIQCKLTVIPNQNYTHRSKYILPIPPSPNLPNQKAILLYPSLCLFEGTVVSVGRGTHMQFQIYGHPDFPRDGFTFTPRSMSSSKYPKHEGQLCGGIDLRDKSDATIKREGKLNLTYILQAKSYLKDIDEPFFLTNNWINKLVGTSEFQDQINSGVSIEEIRAGWQEGIDSFKKVRAAYLLYDD